MSFRNSCGPPCKRGVVIERELPEPDLLASVDGRQLKIAVQNLISNAVKFTREGSTVTVRVYAEKTGFTFTVVDQGPGIDPAEAERIFERWHRSPDSAAPGLGLGLAIARQIVEMHGGRLDVESTPSEGSTFMILLPR